MHEISIYQNKGIIETLMSYSTQAFQAVRISKSIKLFIKKAFGNS